MKLNDFLYCDMEAVSVNALEGDDLRWRIEIVDKDGNKTNLPWVQLVYMVDRIRPYIERNIIEEKSKEAT